MHAARSTSTQPDRIVSYYTNLPPGGTIVLTGTGWFLPASLAETLRR